MNKEIKEITLGQITNNSVNLDSYWLIKKDKLVEVLNQCFLDDPPKHLDPPYKVGQVVIWKINNKPAPINKVEWNNDKYLYWLGDVHCATKDLIKPYIPTFSVDDTVEVLPIPMGTKLRSGWDITFDQQKAKHIGKKFKIKSIDHEGDIELEGISSPRLSFDPSWLVKCEPERTVNEGEWWLLPESSILRQVDRVSNLDVYFVGLTAAWRITHVLRGKQFRVEEIK